MESIGRGALKTRFIPASMLNLRTFSKVRLIRDLRLIDMVNSGGLTRLGAEGSIVSGVGYRNSQRWSVALRKHPSQPHGIYYRSRHDQARTACALFDSCASMIEVVQTYASWAHEKVLLGAILDHYRFGTDL
jgi:RES domain